MRKIFLLGLTMITFNSFGQDIKATTEEGRKNILKPNKTWIYDESKTDAKNICTVEEGFKEPKYNTSSMWKKIGSTVDDLKKHISVDLGVKQEKIILLEVSEQLGNGVYILCVDGQKMKWRRTGSVFRKDNEDVLNMKNE